MNYANIKYCDISNGIGVRTSLFVSGCNHHCKGCFNEIAWDFNYGELFTNNTMDTIMDSCKPDYIDGLSILGGEPLDPKNQGIVYTIVKTFKDIYPDKDIWVYTGYTYETDLLDSKGKARTPYIDDILHNIDILVDGKFNQDLYDISLKFRGSSNQRLLQINKPGCPILEL